MNEQSDTAKWDDVADVHEDGSTHEELTPTSERPPVEAYDPHFGRHLYKKDDFWRI